MTDESKISLSIKENLLLYVHYLKFNLLQGDAETIYSTISDLLSCNNIEKLNLVGWASDGCEEYTLGYKLD